MKTITYSIMLFLVPALILTSCGGKTEEGKEAKAVKKVDAELEKKIDALAACEEQNTNCEAYTKTSEYIQAACKDEKKCEAIIADLFTMIEMGPSAKSQAAAHAVNFWTYGNFRENAEYGKIVLAALLKEKYDQKSYTGSQLGGLLASWFTTSDKDLYASLLKAVKSKDTEMRGRMEMIRLIPYEALGNADLFSALTGIINDAEENKDVRIQCLNVLWRVENEDMKASARSVYEGFLSNPEVQIAGTSLLGLGYLKSYASYDVIEQTILANKDNQDWCYYGSYCLSELVRDEASTADKDKVLALAKTMLTNKNCSAYYRSYYVSTLYSLNTPGAKALLTQLKGSAEKEIVDEIKNREANS